MAPITVIVNPTKFPDLESAHDALDRQFANFGIAEYDWVLTTAEDTGAGQTKAAVESGAEMVISWGGDGTVRAVAMGLLGSDVPLGILPGGTGNLIAKNLDLPDSLSGALGVALGGGALAVDVNDVDLGDGVRRISMRPHLSGAASSKQPNRALLPERNTSFECSGEITGSITKASGLACHFSLY